jgi:hypothetical protein
MTRLLAPDERAEALGERVGRSAVNAAQRLRSLASRNLAGTDDEGTSVGTIGEGRTERAEYLVNSIESAVGRYSRVVGDRLRWMVARAREEMEDIVAEAQSRRRPGVTNSETGDKDLVAPS